MDHPHPHCIKQDLRELTIMGNYIEYKFHLIAVPAKNSALSKRPDSWFSWSGFLLSGISIDRILIKSNRHDCGNFATALTSWFGSHALHCIIDGPVANCLSCFCHQATLVLYDPRLRLPLLVLADCIFYILAHEQRLIFSLYFVYALPKKSFLFRILSSAIVVCPFPTIFCVMTDFSTTYNAFSYFVWFKYFT